MCYSTALRIHITAEMNSALQVVRGFRTESRGLIDVKVFVLHHQPSQPFNQIMHAWTILNYYCLSTSIPTSMRNTICVLNVSRAKDSWTLTGWRAVTDHFRLPTKSRGCPTSNPSTIAIEVDPAHFH